MLTHAPSQPHHSSCAEVNPLLTLTEVTSLLFFIILSAYSYRSFSFFFFFELSITRIILYRCSQIWFVFSQQCICEMHLDYQQFVFIAVQHFII